MLHQRDDLAEIALYVLRREAAQAVVGVREGGTQAMRFDVVRVPAEQTLGDYLNSGWMEGVEKSSTEDLNINGFPAASATAHGDQWQFKVYALRFGSDVYRFIFAAKQKSTESERNARETVNSFRRLTLDEIQAARPLRIKVINVQPGEPVRVRRENVRITNEGGEDRYLREEVEAALERRTGKEQDPQ